MCRYKLISLLFINWIVNLAIADQKPIKYIGIEQGLSNNNVTKIFQDKSGFMWIGTYDGLNRYDGYDFQNYKNDPGKLNSLPDNRITDIVEDQDGTLWVATKVGAAELRHGATTFKRITIDYGDNRVEPIDFAVNQLAIGKNNTVFAGSEQAGLLKINKELAESVLSTPIPLKDKGESIHRYNVQGLTSDRLGNLWLLVNYYGLCYYDYTDQCIRIMDRYISSASELISSPDGDLWFATEGGVYRYDQEHKKYTHYAVQNGLSSNNILGISFHDNHLWVYTDGAGIDLINSNDHSISHFNTAKNYYSLKSESVNAVYKDPQSRIWIGTLRGGINIIDPHQRKFNPINIYANSKQKDLDNYVLSFAEGKDDRIWVGTDGGGLVKWHKSSNQFTLYHADKNKPNSLSNNFVTSIQEQDDHVWVSTYGGGINRLDLKNGKFKTYYCVNPHNNYNSLNVWRISIDSKGQIWACTLNGGGTFKYDPSNDSFQMINTTIYDVLTMYEESPDIYWFGSWATLMRLDQRTGNTQTFQIGKPVRSIHPQDNKLWLATEGGGLLYFDKASGAFERYTEKDGLPSNTLLNILEDDADNLWISSYNGLTKFDRLNHTFQNYSSSDGLQSNQFSYNAALKLQSGELLFGGIRGFNIFTAANLDHSVAQPQIVFTSFNINHKPFDQYTYKKGANAGDLHALKIAYDDAAFSFGFAALEYSFPDKIEYAYYLDGWDKDWNYVKNQRTAHYSGLREGTYTLRIKSTNANGVWGDAERTIQIQILPPWWRTGWAYFGYAISILSLLYFFRRYEKTRTRLKYKIKLAERDAQKEQELVEKKIAFFTHITHEFRNPLTLIVNPIKEMIHRDKQVESQELINVYNNSRRLLSLVDKLLLFRKAESDFDTVRLVRLDVIKLCHEVFQCFKQQATMQNLIYTFECSIPELELLADREKIEICLFNLISNAIKFTPEGGRVIVRVEHDQDDLQIHVIDSGCGISTTGKAHLFKVFHRDYSNNHKEGFGIGLFLVKKFAEAHNGSISFHEQSPQGARFTLSLKIGEKHFKDALIFEDVGEHSLFMDDVLTDITVGSKPSPTEEIAIEDRKQELRQITEVVSDKKTMLIVDDNEDIRNYLHQLFSEQFNIRKAESGEAAMLSIEQTEPHIILSDVVMEGLSGIDLCSSIKNNPAMSHIPIILLTATSSQDIKLKGLEGGADDYITKPFDKDILIARVNNLIQSRNRLQGYFYNEITLQQNDYKISSDYKEFIEKAISIVEKHLDNPSFNVKTLADEIGMSHSNMYKKIKSMSGQSANEFIRFVRLRKVAKLLIENDCTINEAAFSAGFNDIKYFRTQFSKLFGMNPSEYKKKYQALKEKHHLNTKYIR